MGKDYEEHIRNKALLSYDSSTTAERLAEYLAGEILVKDRLEWLKARVDLVLKKLGDTERTLVAIRYFGVTKHIRDFLKTDGRDSAERVWSERKYFRRQMRLGEKLGAMLVSAGVTKEVYLRDFADVDMFAKIQRFVDEEKDGKISADERRRIGGRGLRMTNVPLDRDSTSFRTCLMGVTYS